MAVEGSSMGARTYTDLDARVTAQANKINQLEDLFDAKLQAVSPATSLGHRCICIYYIPVNRNTALLSSHRDKILTTLVLRPSTKLSFLLFRQF